jgi:hypothetical protein
LFRFLASYPPTYSRAMPLINFSPRLLIVALASACTTSLWAQDSENNHPSLEFGAEIRVGGEYDSNVAVDEVDLNSAQSDYSAIMGAKLEANSTLSNTVDLDFSYDFSQSIYKEFSAVDRQTHILGSNLSIDMGKIDGGLSLFYIDSRLDNKKFLQLSRVSPSLSGFISKKLFARGAYVYSDKVIERNNQRDAISNSGEIDIYFFRRGLRSYFNVGYLYKDEDAQTEEYDYKSGNIKVRYIHRFDLLSRVATLELGYRYEDRDYRSATPSIGEVRSDERHRWRIDFELPVIERGAVKFYATYGDYRSNLPRADYDQNIIGTRFVYAW